MALDSSSTYTEVVAQFDDNGTFEIDDSVSKARLFIEACIILLRRRPTKEQRETINLAYDNGAIERMKNEALDFLRTHPDNASKGLGTTYADLSEGRI